MKPVEKLKSVVVKPVEKKLKSEVVKPAEKKDLVGQDKKQEPVAKRQKENQSENGEKMLKKLGKKSQEHRQEVE